jgi:ubiquinone biosynthesis protein COQ9
MLRITWIRGEAMTGAQDILDTALALGEQRGWDAVQLHEVAREMGIPLAVIRVHYAQKDALAEAWFDRADAKLLSIAETPGWRELPVTERLHRALFAWFDALASHRELTRAMLRYKFQPEHLHLQVLGATRVSATVQWIREVACLDSAAWQREIEEAALTGIYLATFARWLNDDSTGSSRTHAFLDQLLAIADRGARLAFGK